MSIQEFIKENDSHNKRVIFEWDKFQGSGSDPAALKLVELQHDRLMKIMKRCGVQIINNRIEECNLQ